MTEQLKNAPKERQSHLVGIFLLGLLLFNFPLIYIFGKEGFILGVPIVFAYLFVAWLAVIILIFWTFRT
ncbi:MAG: hypothetical protein GYB31_15345 [Bacteroidetes bacterium]|nr:hypothetical protein [Bacteroidota bacterium]